MNRFKCSPLIVSNTIHIEENQQYKIRDILISDKTTKISIFLSSLDCKKIYTEQEILELLQKAKYYQPKSMFNNITKMGSKWGCGRILEQTDNQLWKIKSDLIGAWQK